MWQAVTKNDAFEISARSANLLVPGSLLYQEDDGIAAALWQSASLDPIHCYQAPIRFTCTSIAMPEPLKQAETKMTGGMLDSDGANFYPQQQAGHMAHRVRERKTLQCWKRLEHVVDILLSKTVLPRTVRKGLP